MTNPPLTISARNLTLTLGSDAAPVDILRGIDLDVADGEVVALLGPSGSGKSSLMAVLSGLERATSGSLTVAGQNFTALDEDALAEARRGRVGIVLQAFHLLPTMTAAENVATPMELSGASGVRARAEEELRAVGLGHRLDHYPTQLSGGDQMRQAEMVGRGALDLVVTSAINVTPLVPEMAVFSLPYMYSNYDQVDATTQGAPGEMLAEILGEKGIVVLAWGENGFREITNNIRPIKTPDDMKGLNMRVAGPMYIDVMNALGANPQQMQWGETMTALQQGVVDGQENPIGAVIIPQQVYEVQKYLTTWH